MSRKFALVLIAFAFVVGCKGKQTKTDSVESTPIQGQQDTQVESTPMSFDNQGSDSGKIDGLVTIHFDYDKASLSAETKKQLQGNAAWIKNHSGTKVQIEGHCDARGSIEYNLALGERRANAVKAYLVSLGVSSGSLSTISYGKDKPLVQGDGEEAYAKNRRANFVPAK